MGLAGDGTVQREPIPIGGKRLGCRAGSCQGRVLQCEGSAAGAWSDRDTVTDRGGVQCVDRVCGFQVEPGLFGVIDEEPVEGELDSIDVRWEPLLRFELHPRLRVRGAPKAWRICQMDRERDVPCRTVATWPRYC